MRLSHGRVPSPLVADDLVQTVAVGAHRLDLLGGAGGSIRGS
jgi:hypothetical protein